MPFQPSALLAGISEMMQRVPLVQDGDGPVLDNNVYASTASVLPRDQVRMFLNVLIDRSEDLLGQLTGPEGADNLRGLVASAHKLGGSAGSFGFRRLADSAAAFEYVVDATADDTAPQREALRRATEASVGKLRELALAA